MTSKEQDNPPASVQQNGREPLIPFPEQTQGRSRMVLVSCAVLTAAMAVVTCVLINGFDLTTVNASTLSEDDKSDLLNKYNKNSAAVVGAVNVLLALFFLGVWVKAVRNPNQTIRATCIPVGVGLALIWVLGQGMSALNVQFKAANYEKTIQSSDLMDTSRLETFAFATSSITNTTHVTGNPSNDTILRSAIRLQAPNSSTCCTAAGYVYQTAEVLVRYGFPLNSWLGDLLSESVASNESYSISMGADYSNQQISETVFPGGDLNKSAELFAYSFWTMWQYFGDGMLNSTDPYTELTDISQGLQTTDGTEFISSIQALMASVTSPLEALEGTSNLPSWVNISMPEITVEFANFQLSPLIKFESVTFDLPVTESVMKDFLEQPNATDYYWTPRSNDYCNDYACVLDSDELQIAIPDQIRLLPLCMSGPGSTQENMSAFVQYQQEDPVCQFISNTSVLVFSIAHHISADEVNYTIPAYRPHRSPSAKIELKNPRKTYSVTVGRLSWQTTDLAEQYGANCAFGSNCDGLYFPLSNDKQQHLVLGKSQVPRSHQPFSTYQTNEWDMLAMQMNTQLEIIYPPNYKFTADSDEWTQLSRGNCSYRLASFVNSVVQNHVYSTDSVQPAYTAAMFWLFQNAALRDVLPVEGGSGFTLVSQSNVQKLSSRVAISLISAVITCVGVVLVLLLGLLIACSAGKQATRSVNTAA